MASTANNVTITLGTVPPRKPEGGRNQAIVGKVTVSTKRQLDQYALDNGISMAAAVDRIITGYIQHFPSSFIAAE